MFMFSSSPMSYIISCIFLVWTNNEAPQRQNVVYSTPWWSERTYDKIVELARSLFDLHQSITGLCFHSLISSSLPLSVRMRLLLCNDDTWSIFDFPQCFLTTSSSSLEPLPCCLRLLCGKVWKLSETCPFRLAVGWWARGESAKVRSPLSISWMTPLESLLLESCCRDLHFVRELKVKDMCSAAEQRVSHSQVLFPPWFLFSWVWPLSLSSRFVACSKLQSENHSWGAMTPGFSLWQKMKSREQGTGRWFRGEDSVAQQGPHLNIIFLMIFFSLFSGSIFRVSLACVGYLFP